MTERAQLFRTTFDRYVAHTDGKEKLAREIAALASSMRATRLLDLGAGNGILTRLVSPYFRSIVAVEHNRAFESALGHIPNTVPVMARMEDHVPVEPPDLVLMVHSLDGIPLERLGRTLTQLFSHLAPGGKIAFVTQEDGCPGDRFGERIHQALGLPLYGGSGRQLDDLRRAGFDARRLSSIDGFIWARDRADLLDVLEFFFLDAIDAYRESRPVFEKILGDFVEPFPGERVAIRAVESIYEVVRPEAGVERR